ncbi:MAG: hypothetical protein ACTSQO_13420 [Candidatus Helarchaeota archaeon]
MEYKKIPNQRKKDKKGKIDIAVLLSSILIIVLSILSVISAFFIYNIQSQVKINSENSDLRYRVVSAIEKDVEMILDEDKLNQQLALGILEDLKYLNELINESKAYNQTHPGTYSKDEIDSIALEFVGKIEILNNLIRQTYAYNWSEYNNATKANNYSYFGMENFLIRNNYQNLKSTLEQEVLFWINKTYYPNEPEILDVDLYNWEGEMFYYLGIVEKIGQYTPIFIKNTGINISSRMGYDYYMLLSDAYYYKINAQIYDQTSEILTTALVLMTVGAVVVAFVVSINQKTYIYTALTIGIIVSIISIWFFGLGITYFYTYILNIR